MKLLVVGSGGREHALAWKLAQSPRVQKVFVAPGNGGTATEAGLENVAITAIPELIAFARRETIALTVGLGEETIDLDEGLADLADDGSAAGPAVRRALAAIGAYRDGTGSKRRRHRVLRAAPVPRALPAASTSGSSTSGSSRDFPAGSVLL